MAKPWRKDPWPYVRKRDGKKSYRVGFYDHEGRARSRAFSSVTGVGGAKEWMDDYIAAERRGKDSLRRFLLDLDAKEADAHLQGQPLGRVVQLYFAHNGPDEEEGLAPATYDSYEKVAYRHILGRRGKTPQGDELPPAKYALELANTPAILFNEPAAPRAWREKMKRARVPEPTRDRAWKVLSSCLSWAAGDQEVPEVQTNGCILANESKGGSKRRSARRGGTGRAAQRQGPRQRVEAWKYLSPMAVELVRQRLLMRVSYRDELLAHRDATIVSIQYGLACRNQEVYGLRWGALDGDYVDVLEVVSYGQLDDGKTSGSTRRTFAPSLLREDVAAWKRRVEAAGFRTRPVDFIIPGDLGGDEWGVRDPKTSACHFSGNQARKWGPKFFAPAVEEVAKREEYAGVLRATPYSLRRGGISLRLRGEDPQVVADECGTSLQMLDRHYSFAIDELRRGEPRPADEEWRAARARVLGDESRHLRVVA